MVGTVAVGAEQQQAAVLAVGLDGDHPPVRADERGAEHRVEPDVGADVDEGHAGLQKRAYERHQVRFVGAVGDRLAHRMIGLVDHERRLADGDRLDIVGSETDVERGRDMVVIERGDDAPVGLDRVVGIDVADLVDEGVELCSVGLCPVDEPEGVLQVTVGDRVATLDRSDDPMPDLTLQEADDAAQEIHRRTLAEALRRRVGRWGSGGR